MMRLREISLVVQGHTPTATRKIRHSLPFRKEGSQVQAHPIGRQQNWLPIKIHLYFVPLKTSLKVSIFLQPILDSNIQYGCFLIILYFLHTLQRKNMASIYPIAHGLVLVNPVHLFLSTSNRQDLARSRIISHELIPLLDSFYLH